MDRTSSLVIGKSHDGREISLVPAMANRHGLIAGATGTGKTVTLQLLAQRFSALGIPVFTADVKGDLSGIAAPARLNPRLEDRIHKLGIQDFHGAPCPVLFWDVYAKAGLPVRTTVSEIGPMLMGRILQLNETQSQVLQIVFSIADDEGLLLLDLKDLRELLSWTADNASIVKQKYGNIAAATIATIQRNVLTLNQAGGEIFFGEPALQLEHLLQRDFSGNGVVSILDATQLLREPRLYATFLLWLLSELFEELPEVGDLEKPKLVFFFDEAHLLFTDAPNSLVIKIEQVVRLIRSKGVGIYFVTQNPSDIPEAILAQLGNRIQHALRAYTPSEQKAVRTAAQSFRPNPAFDTENVIGELEVGEALISLLDAQGKPTVVERAMIAPPESQIGILSAEQRQEVVSRSPLKGWYDKAVDRESAFEILKKRKSLELAPKSDSPSSTRAKEEDSPGLFSTIFGSGSSRRQSIGEAVIKSIARSAGSSIGRQIVRGVLGGFVRSSRKQRANR